MLLEDETDIQIVGEASDGDEAIALLSSIDTDVLLLDITMPRLSGIDTLKVISKQYPAVRTLMFSMHSNPDYILKAVQHGAAGYLLKDTGLEEILRAVRTVVEGDLYYPPSASSVIIRNLILPAMSRPDNGATSGHNGHCIDLETHHSAGNPDSHLPDRRHEQPRNSGPVWHQPQHRSQSAGQHHP